MCNERYIIEIDSVIVGMAKGMDQYISERYLEYSKRECKTKSTFRDGNEKIGKLSKQRK